MGRSKRTCVYPGCRARAVRNGAFYYAHRSGPRTPQPREAPEPDDAWYGVPREPGPSAESDRSNALYAQYAPVRSLQEAMEAPPGDLQLEIAVMRAALADLVRAGLPITDLIACLDQGMGALVRLLRTNHVVSGEQARNVMDAIETILVEMNMGGSR